MAEHRASQHHKHNSLHEVWWSWSHRFRLQVYQVIPSTLNLLLTLSYNKITLNTSEIGNHFRPLLFSSFGPRPGEPPQSAQDKARMDKEYLSLMAELGEAPVPASGGGHSNSSLSGPRPTGLGNNQSPQV